MLYKNNNKAFVWFTSEIRRYLPVYWHVAAAALFSNILSLGGVFFIMNVYDRIIPHQATATLWALAFGLIFVYIFDFILKTLRAYFLDSVGKVADVRLSKSLMQHLLSINLQKKPENTGELAHLFKDFENVRGFFSSSTMLLLVDIPFIIIFIVVMAYISLPLALVTLIFLPIILGGLLPYIIPHRN